ncbi:hypothetical protein F5B22DRAFT_630582 [Xylaria bambusicola]|uniref:uncharacterized protein n=1 Tax=Xylaria bambusicola TaxID=326684 RepID=UPI0020084628|nr:uncharacterized protein F5B22DRAFT_630582 [Xylaria bambusicola]KAI0503093.1 hypothetical protein F5B22DRAFT_630582 [Xylaria bambusicola]
MTRLPVLPSAPRVSQETSRIFHLPPRKEKRAKASTIFGTSAWNLTSSVPFRWTKHHNDIFTDWIRLKGPSAAATADLVPLLRELELDGYEDINNFRGECVHDLIIVKVRREIANMKGSIPIMTKAAEEKNVGVEVTTSRIGLKEAAARKTCDIKSTLPAETEFITQSRERTKTSEPRSFTQGVHYTTLPIRPAGQMYHVTKAVPGDHHHPLPPPCRSSPDNKPQAKIETSSRATSVNLDNTSRNSHSGNHPSKLDATHQPPEELSLHLRRHNPRRITSLSQDLSAPVEKAKNAMAELSAVVNSLPPDTDSAALETALHDARLEIAHVGKLIDEYLKRRE